MKRKQLNLKIKSVDETGIFTGLGAAYNNVDLGGDKIMPGRSRHSGYGKAIPAAVAT